MVSIKGDDPPYLTVGTEVSAKYKGAFCEAKIRKVVRIVKCKVTFKAGLGGALLSDDLIKGSLRVGSNVEAKHAEKNQFCEATINKIQDCSQYTVVFDDGDITTLRRSALCLKSGRHFNESETLDQLPLTHPEHFSNPVVGGRRGVRRRAANTDADKDDSSEDEDTPSQKGKKKDNAGELGRVVCVEISEKKKGKDNWFPALVVCPAAQETVKIRVKDEYLVRSFKDGRYYTVPKKEITAFVKEQHGKQESNSTVLKSAVDKVMSYLDKDELPPHWDRDALFGTSNPLDSDDQLSDSEASEEKERDKKDGFVAQLYKFMDDRGTPINKVPIVCGKDLDLYRLYNVVTGKGGYGKVSHASQWKPVTIKLGFGIMPSTSTINLVKQAYKKFLFDFEDFYKKLGCNLHTLSSATGKPRNSRGVYRGGSVIASKESKKEEPEEPKKDLEEKEKEKKQAAPPVEPETDYASMDSDGKKSEQSDEPRRSRSRQDVKPVKKDTSDDDKSPEKSTKKKTKKASKEIEKDPAKEEPLLTKAEPPSPAPSQVSQGSKKGRGSRKRKEKEEEPPVKEDPVEPEVEGLSKDVKVELGDKLRVYYPSGNKKVTYEAKVVDANEKTGSYLVHYTGWNTRYDEWIERDRISENASLRTDYQTKSQGKGPSTQNQTPSDGNSESSGPTSSKSTGTKGPKKKILRTTPVAPTSSTGTRSKTGTIKRKRLSAEFEEPATKRKVSRRMEKGATKTPPGVPIMSESESEASDSEQKDPIRTATPPAVVASATSPTRAAKGSMAMKDKVDEDENISSSSIVKEPVLKGTSETAEKEKQNQKIDLIQIRSEMKGLDKIVKNKSPSGGAPSQPSTSANAGQNLDIYDFEEDPNEAPKLKMFSPRSPDKKDDTTTKPEPLVVPVPTKSAPTETATKDIIEPLIIVAPTGPVPVPAPEKSDSVATKIQTKTVQPPSIPVLAVPSPVTPTSAISPVAQTVISSPPLLSSITQTRAIVIASQTPFTPRGCLQPEPRARIFNPTASPPRSRAPTAPPPLVPSSTVLIKASAPPGISHTPTLSIQHPTVPVLTPKPLPRATSPLRPLAPITILPVTPKQATAVTGGKDAKMLPFIARKQELFPHLIQQQHPATSTEHVSMSIGHGDQPSTSHPAPISIQHEKVLTAPSVFALTPHPLPQIAKVAQVPLPLISFVASPADTKKEKKKRVVNKKADLKKPPETPVLKPPVVKKPRAKAGTAKAAKALLALQAEPPKLTEQPSSVTTTASKISDAAIATPVVAFKQSDHPRKIAVSKQSAASKASDKRASPMKQNFLKCLASLEKEQRMDTAKAPLAGGSKPVKPKAEEKSAPITLTPLITTPSLPSISASTSHSPLVPPVQKIIPNLSTKETIPVIITPSKSTVAAGPQPSTKSSMVVIENLPKAFKSSNVSLQIQGEIKEKVATQDLPESKVPVIPFVQDIAPEQEINVNIESVKKPTEQAVQGAMQDKEAARPITPSILFLTSEETLEPEDTEQMTKLNEIAAAAKSHSEDLKKEEESCSSLLCEEEIPGSPTADDEDRLRFDFKDEIGDKTAEKDLPEPGTSGTGARVRGLPVNRSSESRDKKRSSRQDESFPPVEKIPLGPSFSSALGDNTPPSTPESTTLSNETGGSPHLDGGRISPTGEGGSSKSKESTDGDSGDASKTYYGDDGTRKSRKMSEPPPSPVNKRPRESRGGRNLSPPAKRRRVPRRKSPEELSRPFNYRGGRSSSSRKGQSGSDTHEVIKAPPPPPPINLGKPPKSAKFNFIPEFDESSTSDQRVSIIMQAISSLREKYNEVKVKQQTLERRQKRRKKKERERVAAERRARQEAATALIGS